MNKLIADLLMYVNLEFRVKDDGYTFQVYHEGHPEMEIKVINPGDYIEDIIVNGKITEFPKLAEFILGLRFPDGYNPNRYKEMFK